MSDSTNSDDAPSSPQSSGSEESRHDDLGSEDEGESSSENNNPRGFFDLEAGDDDEDDDDDDESGSGSDGDSEGSEDDSDASSSNDEEPLFPRFMRLPPELRRGVWSFFCPEMVSGPRLLEFAWTIILGAFPISVGSSTADVTEPARTLAAVDGETRAMALRAFPDVLKLASGDGEVRFDSRRDIVMLQLPFFKTSRGWSRIPGFSDQVRCLAINVEARAEIERLYRAPKKVVDSFYTTFPNLERVHVFSDRAAYAAPGLAWAESEKNSRFTLRTWNDEAGLMKAEERLFIWPDLVNHREYTVKRLMSPHIIRRDGIEPSHGEVAVKGQSIEMWPMVEWSWGRSVLDPTDPNHTQVTANQDFSAPIHTVVGILGQMTGHFNSDYSQNGESHSDGPDHALDDDEDSDDQYENDFVVDDGIIEYDDADSDALDFDDGSGDDGHDGGHGQPYGLNHRMGFAFNSGTAAAFSDLEPESGSDGGTDEGSGLEDSSSDSGDDDAMPAAQFSDLESESETAGKTNRGGDEDDSSSEAKSESESDDDDDVRQVSGRNRVRRAVISDDEEEDDDQVRPAPMRSRVRRGVISEDEDDDDE